MKLNRQFIFGQTPSINLPRSRFDLSHSIKTAFNQGELIPVLVQECYPGDTFKVSSVPVVRTSTPYLRPVMDNNFIDLYYFFVPNRLVYHDFQAFMGENTQGPWYNQTVKDPPFVSLPGASSGVVVGSLADYLGIPLGLKQDQTKIGTKVSKIPFRAYALIWNEWFRNENIQDPVQIEKTGGTNGIINGNAWSPSNYTGMPAPVCKIKDYFTSCLPAPQKGPNIDIPLSQSLFGVYATSAHKYNQESNYLTWQYSSTAAHTPLNAATTIGTTSSGQTIGSASSLTPGYNYLAPDNLEVDLSNLPGTINDLRFAFALQRMLEKDARFGTRYTEYLQGHFGVISPDSRLQRPEFLGGKRISLNIAQVAQTSQGTEDSPLANMAGYSLTAGQAGFSKGIVEHGFIIGVACIRQVHTYQQGLERFWLRNVRTDYYDPCFANIGEQPVYAYELDATTAQSKQIFGYNEAFADLRFKPNRITGYMRSASNSGLDLWHFGDVYANTPVLGDDFIKENKDSLDRTLSSDMLPNFIVDIKHNISAVRVMPTYAIPGLVDHH
ncbi:major capsid protein [Capybara microvirus Cap3_SP_562]|nr:major capsid protein [Capybara microvirus Cap3_SP_562]